MECALLVPLLCAWSARCWCRRSAPGVRCRPCGRRTRQQQRRQSPTLAAFMHLVVAAQEGQQQADASPLRELAARFARSGGSARQLVQAGPLLLRQQRAAEGDAELALSTCSLSLEPPLAAEHDRQYWQWCSSARRCSRPCWAAARDWQHRALRMKGGNSRALRMLGGNSWLPMACGRMPW